MLEHQLETRSSPERVVVVGSAGFVGSAICAALAQRGVPYLGVTRQQVDLLDAGASGRLKALLRENDALVAVAAIAPCKDLTMLQDNLRLAGNLAEAISGTELAHVVNISSDAIYADSGSPLNEQACASPGSLHGAMHLCRELMLKDAAAEVSFASLRPTLIYGANDPHNGYGPNRFRRLAMAGEAIVLFGEGEERRDHVLVDDVAELAVLILEHRSRGAINAATGTVVSFREAAQMIVQMNDESVPIQGSPRSGPMPHDGYRPFDPSGTARAFPEFTYTQPEEGFARVLKQVKGNIDG